MPRPSPFAGLADGPAADAETVELGRPTRTALGCFGVTALFLAMIGSAALSYGAFGVPGPRSAPGALRGVAAVAGTLFMAIVAGLVVVAVRAVRARQGLAFDATGVWWRSGAALVRLPWSDVAEVRLTRPVVPRGQRSSVPRTAAVEVCPVAESVVRNAVGRHPELAGGVVAGEQTGLRFAFRLPAATDEARLAAAVTRFAPMLWRTS